MRVRLVEGADKWWTWFSVHALGLITLVPLVWAQLPPEITALLPEAWRPWILAAVGLAGLVGRLVDQGGDRT